MLLYYMTSDHWGITALRDKRLKLARIADLNDPYELQAVHPPPEALHAWRAVYDLHDRTRGVLCFSERWSSPVMWAHYADKHSGICLGFEIPTDNRLYTMKYHHDFLKVPFDPTEEHVNDFFCHKFIEWEYERERRAFHDLKEVDKLSGLYFANFNETMVLKEVILGVRNPHFPDDFKELLEAQAGPVSICIAQASGTRFEILEETQSRRTFGT